MKRAVAVVALLSTVILLTGARRRAAIPPAPPAHVGDLDFRRSVIVTDVALLDDTFSLQRVFRTLIDRAGARITPTQLYQQMFDTQNAKPGLAVADAPHCDDFLTNGKPSFNGFPRRCPTPEGLLATTDPFAAQEYKPTALVNRFDKAPQDGSNCGEYRMVFSRFVKPDPQSQLRIIVEGVLPNPHPEQHLLGCRGAAQFWANLSSIDSVAARREQLERFFFTGIDGYDPVIHPDHYGKNGGGIRTFQFTPSMRPIPRFFQFRVQTDCSKSPCRILMVPDVLENLAWVPLFNGTTATDQATQFRKDFIQQVATLALPEVNYYENLPRQYLSADIDATDEFPPFASDIQFRSGLSTQAGKDFNDAVTAELKRVGSPITPMDLMLRGDSQNCAGCHLGGEPGGGGVDFPRGGDGLAHVSETIETAADGTQRYQVSPAVRDVFAPNRARLLRDFLNNGTLPLHAN